MMNKTKSLTLKQRIIAIFTIFAKHNPHPTTELVYSSAFELLVAVVLSAQATDVGVNKATKLLFANANTPQAILALGQTKLESYIKTIGLYKAKAKNILGLCTKLIQDYDSQVPSDYDSLVSLPGVGRKTANVILNTLFGQHKIAVDTHVFRVSNRLGIAKGKTPLEVELKLDKNIPNQFKDNAHHWLILHGRYVCKARTPECHQCKVSQFCTYFNSI